MPAARKTSDPPRDALELLALEEARTLADLQHSLVNAAEDVCRLDDVREGIRRNPTLAVAASAAVGVLLAPWIVRAARFALPSLLAFGQSHAPATGLGRILRRQAQA